MSDEPTGEVLNHLLRNARDSAEGFRQGASLASNPTFQSLFTQRAEEREGLIRTIEGELRSFGAEPAREGTVIGGAHKLFTYARDLIDRGSDKGLVQEIVRREGLVAQSFEGVARDDTAPEPARRIAAEALATLNTEHRELEGLEGGFAVRLDPAAPHVEPSRSNQGRPRMASHFKLNEEDHGFLAVPNGASVLFAGSSGTQTWIERAQDGVVRIGIQSVAVATAEGASLSVSIEVGDQQAKGEDGPAPVEHHLSASQSVQLLVKAGERVAFKAYPSANSAHVLRTVVWASDLGAPKS